MQQQAQQQQYNQRYSSFNNSSFKNVQIVHSLILFIYYRQPGGLNYANQNNENIYMPRVLKNYDEHESSPRMYPPHAQFENNQQNNSNYEPQLSPSR